MTLQSSLQMTQKQVASAGIQWNPFKDPVQDTALITRTMIMANTLSFNRTDPHWGFDISNTRNTGKSLLTYGFESRQSNDWSLRTRINLNKSVALNDKYPAGYQRADQLQLQFRQQQLCPAFVFDRAGPDLYAPLQFADRDRLSPQHQGELPPVGRTELYVHRRQFRFQIQYPAKHVHPGKIHLQQYQLYGKGRRTKHYVAGFLYDPGRAGAGKELSSGVSILPNGWAAAWRSAFNMMAGKPAGQGVINTGRASLRAIL